jgi:hypothetical protein
MVLILALALSGMYWSRAEHILIVLALVPTFTVLLTLPPVMHASLRRAVSFFWMPARLKRPLSDAMNASAKVTLTVWWRLLGLSLLIHLITCGSYAWAAKVTGVHGEMWRIALYYAVFNLAVLLPITVAGVGLREQCAVWFFGRAGAMGAASVALSWFVLATTLVHVLIGALLHLRLGIVSGHGGGQPESDVPSTKA